MLICGLTTLAGSVAHAQDADGSAEPLEGSAEVILPLDLEGSGSLGELQEDEGSGGAIVISPGDRGEPAEDPSSTGEQDGEALDPDEQSPDEEAPEDTSAEQAVTVRSLGARARASREPAERLARHVAEIARGAVPDERAMPGESLASTTEVTAEIAAALDVRTAQLSDIAELRTLESNLGERIAESQEESDDLLAGARVLSRRTTALSRSLRSPVSRIDVEYALRGFQLELASEATRRAYLEVEEAERRVARLEAELDYVRRRIEVVQSAAQAESEAAPTRDVEEIQEEISEIRQRLDEEVEQTSRIEQDAARAQAIAEEQRARARTEEERRIADSLADASAELTQIAADRRLAETEQGDIASAKEQFLVRRAEFEELIDELEALPDDDSTRAERADQVMERVFSQRLSARERALGLRDELAEQRQEVQTVEAQLLEAQAEVEALREAIASGSGGTLASRRLELFEQLAEVAERRVELSEWKYEIRERRWSLTRQEVYFYALASDRLVPLLSDEARAEHYSYTQENLAQERANIRDRLVGLQLLTRDRLQRLGEFTSWLVTFEGAGWLVRALGGLIIAWFLVRLVTRRKDDAIVWTLERLRRSAIFKKRWPLVLKFGELMRDTARILSILLVVSLLTSRAPTELPEVELLRQLALKGLYFLAANVAARTLLIPREQRKKTGLDARDIEKFGIDIFKLEFRSARLSVLTLRVWLLYTFVTSVASDFTHFVFGESLLSHSVDQLFLYLHIVLVYVLLWFWRDVIVDATVRLTGMEGKPQAEWLAKHKNRFYSVVFLVFLAIYVLAIQASAIVRRWVEGLSVSRQVRNFLFRKRVERAQAATRSVDTLTRPDGPSRTLKREYVEAMGDSSALDASVWIRRTAEEESLQTSLDSWRADKGECTGVVVGERGMGKSTFVEQTLDSLSDDVRVIRHEFNERILHPDEIVAWVARLLELPECHSDAELIEHIADMQPTLIVMEDAHLLFLRTINGFRGLDAFLRIVSLAGHHIYWLLTFDAFAWNYVNRVRDRRHHFDRIVRLSPFDEQQIQNIIERRNSELDVQPDYALLLADESQSSNAFEVIRSAAGYFRLLTEFAAGNPRVAMHYWLASLEPGDDGKVDVRLFERPSAIELKRLSTTQLFSLVALVQHEVLSARELCQVVAGEEDEVELDLEALKTKEFIELDPRRGARITVKWMRTIIDELRNRNLLYIER